MRTAHTHTYRTLTNTPLANLLPDLALVMLRGESNSMDHCLTDKCATLAFEYVLYSNLLSLKHI